ncbi:MAG: succinylglutamate desuccinylase/aspartoacylase family protein [Alphaproteobacteria bacterium]|nr:MAG: succinylglutamate desuccinylase/aspartoacylase family protein [Alphaproteobacteria bacterium]
MTIEILRFAAIQPGPHMVVLGAVHGNETCGTAAIRTIVDSLIRKDITLARGAVTFVPVANPLAYERGVRYIDRNLNRDLRRRARPVLYEDYLGNILCPVLESCDFLLDLHSYHSKGPAFLFAGPPSQREDAYRAALGQETEIYGWSDAYARLLGKVAETDDRTSIGTTEYARQYGATAVTLECGWHKDPASVQVAMTAILRAMSHAGLLSSVRKVPPRPARLRIRLEHVYWRTDGGELAKDWKHADSVKAGDILAIRADGTPVTAQQDGYILLPRHDCPLGEEWFYVGTRQPAHISAREAYAASA